VILAAVAELPKSPMSNYNLWRFHLSSMKWSVVQDQWTCLLIEVLQPSEVMQ